MKEARTIITLESYLEDLAGRHPHCLLHLDVNWSGHARLYRNLVRDLYRRLRPRPHYLRYCLDHPPFDQMPELSSLTPIIYYFQDGRLKTVIEGIHARHDLLARMQLPHRIT